MGPVIVKLVTSFTRTGFRPHRAHNAELYPCVEEVVVAV